MLETKKTKEGFIYAYAEWWLVNQEGKIDKDGKYIWVNDAWVHKAYRGNGIIRSFIHRVAQKYPHVEHMYYRPGGKPGLEIYSRKQLKEKANDA